jgi:hypothetical protein
VLVRVEGGAGLAADEPLEPVGVVDGGEVAEGDEEAGGVEDALGAGSTRP